MSQRERDIEKALVAMVERHGGLCLKWTCPGWVGVPDRIILLPGGRVAFAEVKRPKGGRPGPLQEWWAQRLTRLGFFHLWVYDRYDIQVLEHLIEEG